MKHVKAVVFDWAGTIVDFGSRAPMGAFVEVFRRFGIEISIEQARDPMGLPKRDHIAALLGEESIAESWRAAHGRRPGEAEIDAVYEAFVPLNAAVVMDFADMIPGAVEVVAELRRRGLKIGSTTGYTREIMARLLPVAAAKGYAPDNLVCAGDLAAGRPTPLMMYRTFADLGVFPPSLVVKVDDTEPGIAEGLAAGTWTVGLAISGNLAGFSLEEWTALDAETQRAVRERATEKLRKAGAHVVIDSVADLMNVIEAIGKKLEAGERP